MLCNDCNPDVDAECTLPGTPLSRARDIYEAPELESTVVIPKSVQTALKEEILRYYAHLMSDVLGHATALVVVELCTGLTDKTIANIAENISLMKCESNFMKYGVTSQLYCGD